MSHSRAFRLSEEELRALRKDVIAVSYVRGDFVLQSGPTRYYFDKYLFLTRPSILRRLATALAGLVPPDTDRLACAELGGVPLTTAVSLELGIPYAILRREPRDGDEVEGELAPGDHVVLVEDVVASGRHAATYVSRLRASAVVVRDVVAVLDRLEGARKVLEGSDCTLTALFTLDQAEIA